MQNFLKVASSTQSQDAGCESRIIATLGQPADHPVALNFPEGRYLKGLVCCTYFNTLFSVEYFLKGHKFSG